MFITLYDVEGTGENLFVLSGATWIVIAVTN